jgi:hypothetical protein
MSFTGLTHDRESGQLLERVEDLALSTDQNVGVADDRHMGSIALDIGVDIPVQVSNVEQLLEVISSDLSLNFERTFRPSAAIAGLH